MIGFLTFLLVSLSIIMALFIYIQQGKGDMGLGAIGGSSQNLFGGSGGRTFFETATWTMVVLFILGALGLSLLKTRGTESRVKSYKSPIAKTQAPVNSNKPQEKK